MDRIGFRRRLVAVVFLFAVLFPVPSRAQAGRQLKTIGFMTDFDVRDDAVGICKAVMDGVAPGVHIIDITECSGGDLCAAGLPAWGYGAG